MRRSALLIFFIFPICVVFSQDILIQINTDLMSLCYQVTEEQRLYQIYLGKKMNLDNTDFSFGTQRYSAYTTFGMTEYNEVALRATHSDGNTSTDLIYETHLVDTLADGREHTIIKCKDRHYPFFVELHFRSNKKENVIEQWSVISHQEKKATTLFNFASSQLTLNASQYYLTQFSGDYVQEMNLYHQRLVPGIKIIDSKMGTRATQFNNPSYMVSLGGLATENKGDVLGATLAWPGNFQLLFEIQKTKELRILSGINPYGSHYLLEKNQLFETPKLIFTYSQEGFGGISRNIHRWARQYGVYKGEEDRYTLMNNWEATYFDFNEPKICDIIEDAKKMNLDLFLLDDGWFGNKYPRNNDNAGLGDWQINKTKLPNGVFPFIKACHEKEMKFGIWIEPEMVNPKSELFERHPEWVIGQKNRTHSFFRNQLVLDLCNPDVQNFVYKTWSDILKYNPGIDYVKMDCNRYIMNGGSNYLKAEKQSHLYIEYARGLQDIFRKVRNDHPSTHMMLCSGGGGRVDYGSLPYFTEFWPSDNTDALQRIFIQWGYSYFFPAVATCCHVCSSPSHQTGRLTPIKFRFDVAMMGKLGMDLQPANMSEQERVFSSNALREYAKIKHVVLKGDLYRLESPYDSDRASLIYVSSDKSEAVLFTYLLRFKCEEFLSRIKLQGLDKNAIYELQEINPSEYSHLRFNANGTEISSERLINEGLEVPMYKDFGSRVLYLKRK